MVVVVVVVAAIRFNPTNLTKCKINSNRQRQCFSKEVLINKAGFNKAAAAVVEDAQTNEPSSSIRRPISTNYWTDNHISCLMIYWSLNRVTKICSFNNSSLINTDNDNSNDTTICNEHERTTNCNYERTADRTSKWIERTT
jgi:hypothetical protein